MLTQSNCIYWIYKNISLLGSNLATQSIRSLNLGFKEVISVPLDSQAIEVKI